jgi:hypothetical protein
MGLDIHMNLSFGINVGSSDSAWEEFEEFEKALANALGIEELEDGVEDAIQELILKELNIKRPEEEYCEKNSKEYSEYWKRKNNAFENYGVGITKYGTCDYPGYILYTKNLSLGEIWEPAELDKECLGVTQDDIDRLRNFCEKYGISYTEPVMMVSAYYSH